MKKNLIILIIIAILATVMYVISGYPKTQIVVCTQEALICPDGSSVARRGPKCEFSPCPTIVKKPKQGKFCGGIAGIKCPDGFVCKYSGNYPDAGGTCVKKTPSASTKYVCPENEYVDCMPGPGTVKPECRPEYLQWAQKNCSNFKGAAY